MGFDSKKGSWKGSPTRVLAQKIIFVSWLVDPENGFWSQKGVTHLSTSQKKLFPYLGWLTPKLGFDPKNGSQEGLPSRVLAKKNYFSILVDHETGFWRQNGSHSITSQNNFFVSWLVDPENGFSVATMRPNNINVKIPYRIQTNWPDPGDQLLWGPFRIEY